MKIFSKTQQQQQQMGTNQHGRRSLQLNIRQTRIFSKKQ